LSPQLATLEDLFFRLTEGAGAHTPAAGTPVAGQPGASAGTRSSNGTVEVG